MVNCNRQNELKATSCDGSVINHCEDTYKLVNGKCAECDVTVFGDQTSVKAYCNGKDLKFCYLNKYDQPLVIEVVLGGET